MLFVISGFLNTGIIRRQLAEGTFSLRTFFSRRIRRIITGLAVVLGFTGVIFCWLDPCRAGQFSESIRRCLLMHGNLAARDSAGAYWGAKVASQPFLHIWCLGVEEKFYILFTPLLVGLAFWESKERCEKDSQGFGDVGPQQLLFTLPSGAIRWRTAENALLYLDDDHITEDGAQLIIRELALILK